MHAGWWSAPEAVHDGPVREPGGARKIEFAHDVLSMRFHGVRAEAVAGGNLVVAFGPGEVWQQSDFSRRQEFEESFGIGPMPAQDSAHVGRIVFSALRDDVECVGQLVEQVAGFPK